MAATSARAASRGNWVSVSRVMTNFTADRAAVSPITQAKPAPGAAGMPRSSALSSASLPRLRSCPIHTPSFAFQRRGRWKRKKMSPSAPDRPSPYLRLSAAIARRARSTSAASVARVSWRASSRSVSRPKCRLRSRLARKRTSSASTSSSTLSARVSRVGTTTSVRHCGGMPAEKSMRGSGCGVATRVASQFTRATPSRLAASNARRVATSSTQARSPSAASPACRGQSSPAAMATVSSAMAPR